MTSERILSASAYAETLHRDQRRKGCGSPYITHLVAVTRTVAEHGGDEDQIIAAYLHDAVEDQGGSVAEQAIRLRFGDRVGDLVMACTDAADRPRPSWRMRKALHLAEIAVMPAAALPIIAADKLDNARSVIEAHKLEGAAVWDRFRGGKREGTLWYYQAMVDALSARLQGPLIEALRIAVEEVSACARAETQTDGACKSE